MTARMIVKNLKDCEAESNICQGDCCVGAVQRAYDEMLAMGQTEPQAFDAALTVFHWHHPEINDGQAALLVRGWVRSGTAH